MSEEEKKNLEEEKKEPGTISRRDFLRDAGLVVGGATIGSMAEAKIKAKTKISRISLVSHKKANTKPAKTTLIITCVDVSNSWYFMPKVYY